MLMCRYVSNVISAFGLGNSSVLTLFKELLSLTDLGGFGIVSVMDRAFTATQCGGNDCWR